MRMKGQVTRPCAAKELTDAGKLAYEDEQGSTRVCTFLLDQVRLLSRPVIKARARMKLWLLHCLRCRSL